MVDSPTTRNRFRKQERGTNVNSWGDNLNEALDCIDQALDGIEAINLGGATSYTLTTTNYTTADEAKNRVLIFSNPAATGCNVIVPSVEHEYLICNTDTVAAIVVKTAAGTGVTVPVSARATVYCDAVNVNIGTPNYVGDKLVGVAAGTANTDAVNVAQLAAAIAASVPAGTAGTFLNTVVDTTRGYLTDKLVASGLLKLSTKNPAGNEYTQVETTGYTASGTDTYTITPSPAITAYAANQAFLVTFTNANTTAATINVNGLGPKSITKNGATALERSDIAAGAQRLLTYDGTQFQISGVAPAQPGASEGLFMQTNFSNWGLLQ